MHHCLVSLALCEHIFKLTLANYGVVNYDDLLHLRVILNCFSDGQAGDPLVAACVAAWSDAGRASHVPGDINAMNIITYSFVFSVTLKYMDCRFVCIQTSPIAL